MPQLMRISNPSVVPCKTISSNFRSESTDNIELVDLTNDNDETDSDDCVFIATIVRHIGECKLDGKFKTNLHDPNKIRQFLLQQNKVIEDSHCNNVEKNCHPVVGCGSQNTLPQEVPVKHTKCELNNQSSCEEKSTSNNYVAKDIGNLDSKNTDISKEQNNIISSNHEPSANYSPTSVNKQMKHSIQIKREFTPKANYSSPKCVSKKKKKSFSTPQRQVGKGTLLDYFQPLSPDHSQCTNILASKENSYTNVELQQQNNQVNLHNNEAIIQNCEKDSLSGSACVKKVILKNKEVFVVSSNKSIQSHSKKTKKNSYSSESNYINVTSNTNDVLPVCLKRNVSPVSEKASSRKKKRTHMKQEMKEQKGEGRLTSISPGCISPTSMRNDKVKKQAVKDFQQCEQTFSKSSTGSGSCTTEQNDCEKKCSDNEVTGYKLATECNITESENKCLAVVEEMLKINSVVNKSQIEVELCHNPSKSEIEASSSQSKSPSVNYSHTTCISSLLHQESRNKSFNEENESPMSPIKSHNYSGHKKQIIKSNHIHESKCDKSKTKDMPYYKAPCSTNTKREEKKSTDLNLEKIGKVSHSEPKFEKSVITQVNADFSSHKELQTATIIKSPLISASILTNIESSKNWDQTIPKESFGESDQSHKSIVNTSQESNNSEKKISIKLLIHTINKVFSEQFCQPWFLFDTSGIPTCCSSKPYDVRQFNILFNVNNMIQLDLPMLAVDHFTGFIFNDGVPDAGSVQKLLQLMLETNNLDVLSAAQCSIISLLGFYPPCFVHSASYYREVFVSPFSENSPVHEGLVYYLLNKLCEESDNSKDENFLSPYVNKPLCLGTSNYCEEAGEATEENFKHENCVCRILLILSNIRYSLASDFSNWIFKYALDPNCNINNMITQPLIATAIWPRSAYYSVGVVKGAISLLVKCCVKLWSFKNLSVSDKSVLIELLHMAAEVTRYSVPINDNNYPFFGPACDALAREVYIQLNLYELDEKTKEHFLHSLKPDWLAMKIGNILISEVINSDTPLVLSTMVSLVEEHYLLYNSGGFIESCPNVLQNETVNTAKYVNVNKLNAKGEVMLHVACRKGNLGKVKSLLDNPHIRVNAQDYAGWTPLQEAIVKNRLECIEALLNYNPPNGERVDTSLANFMEERTPLMTAVIYNNLLACKMLLKHSGPSLLKQKDKDGNTVFEYAQSQELKNFLLEAKLKYKHVKKKPTLNLSIQCWKKLEPILSLTIFKYLITHKIIDITETLKCKQGSNLNTINEQGNVNINVNAYQFKKDYPAYRVLQKLIRNDDAKSDFILDKLGERILWYLTHVVDNSELDC